MPDQQTHDLNNLLGARVTEVEIGFGDGEHLIRRASEHPERTFIGIEKKIITGSGCSHDNRT